MHFGFLQRFAKFINYIVKLSFFLLSEVVSWGYVKSEQEVSRTGWCVLVIGCSNVPSVCTALGVFSCIPT